VTQTFKKPLCWLRVASSEKVHQQEGGGGLAETKNGMLAAHRQATGIECLLVSRRTWPKVEDNVSGGRSAYAIGYLPARSARVEDHADEGGRK